MIVTKPWTLDEPAESRGRTLLMKQWKARRSRTRWIREVGNKPIARTTRRMKVAA